MKKLILCLMVLLSSIPIMAQRVEQDSYLNSVIAEMQKKWPNNRTVNIVFHGHSVPSGYGNAGRVYGNNAYPHYVLDCLRYHYIYSVMNVITTSIGGEQAEQGAKRFERDVLSMHPDVLFIDYALNDRSIGLKRSEKAWRSMIEAALKTDTKLFLMTPTPDLNEDITSDDAPLQKHSEMIRKLAKEYNVALIDSYALFKAKAKAGENLKKYMSQNNHPDDLGHHIVANEILKWFIK